MTYEDELNNLIEQWEDACERLILPPNANTNMDESNSNELRRLALKLTRDAKELRRKYNK